MLVDADMECIGVTVFNLVAGKGFNVGDSIAIPEPYVQETEIKLEGGEVKPLSKLP